jgi:hypothetical protein
MYGAIHFEDKYWEQKREEHDNPDLFRKRDRYNHEPEYKKGTVYLDEKIEWIEEQRGYSMSELLEGDLIEIVEELEGIVAETAVYDPEYDCIDYKYQIESA